MVGTAMWPIIEPTSTTEPLALAAQVGEHVSQHVGRADQVRLDDCVEERRGQLLEAAVGHDPCIVDDPVEAPFGADDLAHGPRHGAVVADVERQRRDRRGAEGAALLGGPFERAFPAGEQGEAPTTSCQLHGHGEAHAAGGTRHEDDRRAGCGRDSRRVHADDVPPRSASQTRDWPRDPAGTARSLDERTS